MGLSFVVVRVRGRLCALPLGPGMETMRTPALPKGESGVAGLLGMTVLRGGLVAMLDLGTLLGFGEGAPGGRMLSAPVDERCVALVVDEVVGVRVLVPEQLTAIALPGAGERPMGRFDEGFAQMVALGGLVREEMFAAVDATSGTVDAGPGVAAAAAGDAAHGAVRI